MRVRYFTKHIISLAIAFTLLLSIVPQVLAVGTPASQYTGFSAQSAIITGYWNQAGYTNAWAMLITPNQTGTAESVTFKLLRTGSPTGYYRYDLYDSSMVLKDWSASYTITSISGTKKTNYNRAFTQSYSVTNGTTYYVGVRAENGTLSSNDYIEVDLDTGTSKTSKGHIGSSWSTYSRYALTHIFYVTLPSKSWHDVVSWGETLQTRQWNSPATWTENLLTRMWQPSTWLIGWNYRKSHVINQTANAGTNYQVRIVVHYGSGTDSSGNVYCNSHSQTNFNDIRFTDNVSSLLDSWMQTYTVSNNAIFWVEIAGNLSASNQTIYIYYGNPTVSTASNGTNTFPLFDNMNNYPTSPNWDYLHTMTKNTTIYYTQNAETDTASAKDLNTMTNTQSAWISRSNDKSVCGHVYQTSANYLDMSQLISLVDTVNYRQVIASIDYVSYQYFWALKYRDGSSWGFINNGSATLSPNTWYFVELLQDGATFYLKANGVQVLNLTLTGTLSANYDAMGFVASEQPDYTYTTYIDDFFVRKYVNPEPTQSTSWGSEEGAMWFLFGLTARMWQSPASFAFNLLARVWTDIATWVFYPLTRLLNDIAVWAFNVTARMWRDLTWLFYLLPPLPEWVNVAVWIFSLRSPEWMLVALWNLQLGAGGIAFLFIAILLLIVIVAGIIVIAYRRPKQ